MKTDFVRQRILVIQYACNIYEQEVTNTVQVKDSRLTSIETQSRNLPFIIMKIALFMDGRKLSRGKAIKLNFSALQHDLRIFLAFNLFLPLTSFPFYAEQSQHTTFL